MVDGWLAVEAEAETEDDVGKKVVDRLAVEADVEAGVGKEADCLASLL